MKTKDVLDYFVEKIKQESFEDGYVCAVEEHMDEDDECCISCNEAYENGIEDCWNFFIAFVKKYISLSKKDSDIPKRLDPKIILEALENANPIEEVEKYWEEVWDEN